MGRGTARRSRRSKKRTHVKASEEEVDKVPKSMVIKMGDSKRKVTHSLAQLVGDFRSVMEPHTAAKLQERSKNKLRDFLSMCGPLGVSHMFVFSNSSTDNTTLRIARTPRGPTLNFRVTQYSLKKDVRRYMKTPRSDNPGDYINPPLLVMNGFTNDQSKSDMETLMSSMFQNMFPPISAQTTNVSSMKRVLMLNKVGNRIDIRHYAIETKQMDGSKQVRKLNNAKRKLHKPMPNLSKASDISDYLLDANAGGYTSESEVEDDAVVEMEAKNAKKSEPTTTKRGVKLVEIGPRMRLDLRKVEEGVCEGKTLHHADYTKTKQEEQELEKKHKKRQQLKDQRRKEQEENVKRKKAEQESKMSRTKRGKLKAEQEEEEEEEEAGNGAEVSEDEGYKNESGGSEPESGSEFDGSDVEMSDE